MLSRFNDSNFAAAAAASDRATPVDAGLHRWEQEQLFEEDLRAVLNMLRPNRHERLQGWSEYRTGGAGFRATISWDPAVERTGEGAGTGLCPQAAGLTRRGPGAAAAAGNPADAPFVIPQMTDVLEAILVGSVRGADEMAAEQEFEFYREVIRELHRRLDEMQRCYE